MSAIRSFCPQKSTAPICYTDSPPLLYNESRKSFCLTCIQLLSSAINEVNLPSLLLAAPAYSMPWSQPLVLINFWFSSTSGSHQLLALIIGAACIQAVMESMSKSDPQAASSPMPPVVNSPNPSAHGPFTTAASASSGQPVQSDPQGLAGAAAMGRVSGAFTLHFPPVLLKPCCC